MGTETTGEGTEQTTAALEGLYRQMQTLIKGKPAEQP